MSEKETARETERDHEVKAGAAVYAEIQSDRCNKRNNSAYEHANFARPATSFLPLAHLPSPITGGSASLSTPELFKLSYLCQSTPSQFRPPSPSALSMFQSFLRARLEHDAR